MLKHVLAVAGAVFQESNQPDLFRMKAVHTRLERRVPHRQCLDVVARDNHTVRRARREEIGAELEQIIGNPIPVHRQPCVTHRLPSMQLDGYDVAVHVDHATEYDAGVDLELKGLIECEGGEIEEERARGLAGMSDRVPVARTQQIQTA